MHTFAEALATLLSHPERFARRSAWPEDQFLSYRSFPLTLHIRPGLRPVRRRARLPLADRQAADWVICDELPVLALPDPLFIAEPPPPLEDPSQPLSAGALEAWNRPPPEAPAPPPPPDDGDALALVIAGVI